MGRLMSRKLASAPACLRVSTLALALGVAALASCTSDGPTGSEEGAVFEPVPAVSAGIDFRNDLVATSEQNIFNYLYFYNGAGVGVGDFDADGALDLYFASSQGADRLYRSSGDFSFEDVTRGAGILQDSAWSTGVSVADFNGDGRLDVYVCVVSPISPDTTVHNRLYINETSPGAPIRFREAAEEFGLAVGGYGNQAALIDYDRDGDLDLYLLRHSVHGNGTYGKRRGQLKVRHPTAGDLFFRNDGGVFTEVGASVGIHARAIGYGLGITTGDFNRDGWPDVYVANDFHEDDYLYLNDRAGGFRESLRTATPHLARFSMGVDAADLNGDGELDVAVLDMLPDDYQINKAAAAEDPYDIWTLKQKAGYWPQYSRNHLLLSQGRHPDSAHVPLYFDGALDAGFAASDWSWSVLLEDYDLDQRVDAFVTNGIRGRSNDLDYLKFISAEENQANLRDLVVSPEDLRLADEMPIIRLPNRLYSGGEGSLTGDFSLVGPPSFSHGAAVADLDGDGDLDLITNDVNGPPQLLRNRSRSAGEPPPAGPGASVSEPAFVGIELRDTGSANAFAVGATVRLYTRGAAAPAVRRVQPVRGYLSSSDTRLVFGLGAEPVVIDSLTVEWPGGTTERYERIHPGGYNNLTPGGGAAVRPTPTAPPALPAAPEFATRSVAEYGIDYVHVENTYVEFNRQRLMPHMTSEEGPALAVGDVDGDGRDDVFFGGAKTQAAELYLQRPGGTFARSASPVWRDDARYEDVDATLLDVDLDGDLDLVVASGGSEYPSDHKYHELRLYVNGGGGEFTRRPLGESSFALVASRVLAVDYDEDGDPDLVALPRTVTDAYGVATHGYFLENDGSGRFADVTAAVAPWLTSIGPIVDAELLRLGGRTHVVVAEEWGPVVAYALRDLKAPPVPIAPPGLWASATVVDFDGDDLDDVLLGGLGTNSKLSLKPGERLRMYVGDLDDNGAVEQIVTAVRRDGAEELFATRDEIVSQLVSIRKRYPTYTGFSKAAFAEIFTAEMLSGARRYEVSETAHHVALQGPVGAFTAVPLEGDIQLTTLRCAEELGGSVVAFGNTRAVNIQRGTYNASYGAVLGADGSSRVRPSETGIAVPGDSRRAARIVIDGRDAVIVARSDLAPVVVTSRT